MSELSALQSTFQMLNSKYSYISKSAKILKVKI